MPLTESYRPEAQFAALGPEFADAVAPAQFPTVILRWRDQRAAQGVGLGALSDGEWEGHFARFEPLPGGMREPLALRYHGHQFRVYNPDIGDGRGFLFAQLRDGAGRLLDLGTKGSGQTPFSRSGDGRLTLKGAVREVLAARMLEAQGVKTCKILSVFETGEALQRGDEPSPTRAAAMVRLQHSHIRIGMFQRHAFHDRPDLIETLIDHCAELYFPHLLPLDTPARACGLLASALAANANLCAQWMAAGFVHGVLNTDNMTVTGESFDYGPWRFLPWSDPSFTAAYFDHQGLYCFGRQPQATGWNLAQLAACLDLVCPQEDLIAVLETYQHVYPAALRAAVFARLGLTPGPLEADLAFLSEMFAWMSESRVPWAQFFHDWFAGAASENRAALSPAGSFYGAPFAPIREALTARIPVAPQRLDAAVFQRPSPPDLTIDAVEALWAPIAAGDDWSLFDAKIAEIEDLRVGLGMAL